MWPTDPKKYSLLFQTLAPSDTNWQTRNLTYWQTDVKNLHFVYQLLKYASDKNYIEGRNWFTRNKNKYQIYKLLNTDYQPTEIARVFLSYVDNQLTQNPNYFVNNVNPFELEYLFHKLLYQADVRETFFSLENVFRRIPNLDVNDLYTVITLVRINNSNQTLINFYALSNEEKEILFVQLNNLLKELKDSGGLRKVKAIVRSEYTQYLDLLSQRALGHQGDGYYRAILLLKAHILLKSLLLLQGNPEGQTLEELYVPFNKHISLSEYEGLLKFEPQIKQYGSLYQFENTTETQNEIYPTLNKNVLIEENEIQKIRSETIELSEAELKEKLISRLKQAETSPIITVPIGAGRHQTREIRHVRNPITSATLRLYFHDICQLCGFDGRETYGTGFSEVDHVIDEITNTQNNRPSNLIVLCPNCHEAKTKHLLLFTDTDDHFVVKYVRTGEQKNIPKLLFH